MCDFDAGPGVLYDCHLAIIIYGSSIFHLEIFPIITNLQTKVRMTADMQRQRHFYMANLWSPSGNTLDTTINEPK